MKTLEVTDEQYAYVQRLREEMSETVVGKYGDVDDHHAVQFLIDNLEDEGDPAVGEGFDAPSMDDVATGEDASATDATATGADAAESAGSDDGAERDPEPEPDAEALSYDEVGGLETESLEGSDGPEEEPGDEEPEDEEPEADEGDEPDDADADDADADDADGNASDDDMLDRMMSLLETHDDKWEESPSADYRYRVTLPDDTTEDVQTKDDVRALLFQHY